MILDSLNNTEKVECLHPLFKKAFDYVKATDFSKMEDGKYELDGPPVCQRSQFIRQR